MTRPRLSRSLHLIVLSLILAGCASPTAAPSPTVPPTTPAPTRTAVPTSTFRPTRTKASTWTQPATITPTSTKTPLPRPQLSLRPGEFYFRWEDQPRFFFSRNLGSNQEAQFSTFLDWAVAGGSQIVRLPLETLGWGFTTRGGVKDDWAQEWERIITLAEADNIYVIPVLGSWIQWNNGSGPSTWASNPMNRVNGGITKDPLDLYKSGSDTQILYLAWVESLVKRWAGHKNIAAWDVFSEINLSQASEVNGISFATNAAVKIRLSDPSKRPVTASLGDTGTWLDFYAKADIDFVQVHPYPTSGQLDRAIVAEVHQTLDTYKLPVFIGESGLSAAAPDSTNGALTVAENSERGLDHAIWAAVVSGAMNGRSFRWEDSFGIYYPKLGLAWMEKFQTEELPAVEFVSGVDFTDFAPVPSEPSKDVWGAAVGNKALVLGWFRDAASEPPDWPVRKLSGQSVRLTPDGTAADWRVDFYNTSNGTDLINSTNISRSEAGSLTIPLPDFTDDIAFKLTALR